MKKCILAFPAICCRTAIFTMALYATVCPADDGPVGITESTHSLIINHFGVPFTIFTTDSDKRTRLLELLGATRTDSEDYDFANVPELLLFCNGPWCDQSPRAINALIDIGYPASKLKYYRGGMQLWKLFGLSTVLPKANTVEK